MGRILLNELVEPVWKETLSPNIAFYPHNVLPLLSLTHRSLRILVLHDLLFLDDTNKSAGNRYRSLKLKHSLSQADLILTVSEASRAEILPLVHGRCQVLVLPNALAEGFDVLPEFEKKKRAGAARIFHFGGYAPTKNTKNVLKAIALLNQNGHSVHLLLGAMTSKQSLVEEWRRETGLSSDALTVLPSLTDSELKQTYFDSDAHCMPSTGEGFGIPVIEAARTGTPNILSPLPVFREILGDNAIYSDSMDAESIARAILTCLNSDTRTLDERARQRTDRFLFESVHQANAVPALSAIEKLAADRSRKGR